MDKKVLIIPTSIASVTLLSGAFLLSTKTHADDVVDPVNITVPVSCTMSGTGMDTHDAEIENGRYVSDIGTTTLHAFCNDAEGFAIYADGYTSNTLGNNVLTNATLGSTYDIITGTATSAGTEDVSNWTMKLAITQDSGDTTGTNAFVIDSDTEGSFGSYHTVPSEYTKVAHKASATDMTASTGGAKLTTTYAVYISKNQPAGTYSGQVKYVLVHPASEEPLQPQPSTAGCINYFANVSDAEGTMGCQEATDNASVTLLASNFSRTGYGFAGWSNKYDYATSTAQDLKFYGPSETITAPAGTTANGLSLYAVWIKSAGNLQDTTKVAELCGTGTKALTPAPTDGTANLTSVSALTDHRDNETYAIAKLADGNCWMIENLRLESTADHNSDGTLSQGYGGQFAGLAGPETPDKFSSTYSANSLYSNDGADDTINIGTSNTIYRMPRYNNINTPTTASDRPQNPTSNNATNTTSNASMYSYGNYYSWHAAIADTTHYTSGDHNTTSICPTGWKLPLGNRSTGDIDQGASDPTNKVPGFSYLDRKMGGTGAYQSTAEASLRWRKYPVNTVYSGYVYSGSVSNRGTYGTFWPSTAYSSYYAYNLLLNSSYVTPGTNNDIKYSGSAVRCVASGV